MTPRYIVCSCLLLFLCSLILPVCAQDDVDAALQAGRGMMIFSYVLLAAGLCIICYYGVTFLLHRWDTAQKHKAEKTASQFEEMFVFVQRKLLIRLYIILPFSLAIVLFLVSHKWLYALIGAIVGAFFPLWLVKFLDGHRRKKFVSQLVDGLMIMNSCLKDVRPMGRTAQDRKSVV